MNLSQAQISGLLKVESTSQTEYRNFSSNGHWTVLIQIISLLFSIVVVIAPSKLIANSRTCRHATSHEVWRLDLTDSTSDGLAGKYKPIPCFSVKFHAMRLFNKNLRGRTSTTEQIDRSYQSTTNSVRNVNLPGTKISLGIGTTQDFGLKTELNNAATLSVTGWGKWTV
jgi:hypothetical protein